MKCPKCGYEKEGAKVCEACGLVFEKYQRYQEMLEQTQQAQPVEQTQRGGRRFLLLGGVVVAVLAVGSFMLFKGDEEVPPAPPKQVVSASVKTASLHETPNESAVNVSGLNLKAQLNEAVPPGNPIEQARNATVFIKTSWGQGAGFFINESCTIVTNRHVVKMSKEDIAETESEINAYKAELENRKRMIRSNKKTFEKIKRGEAKLVDKRITMREFEEKIKDDDKKVNELEGKIQEFEQELENTRWNSRISIVLADGTEMDGWIDRVNDEPDLALVRPLEDASCPAIPVGDSESLSQGDQLFTVGSPMGIRHVVTSGIFSGHLRVNGEEMLQTDAPINPGNSGGPLLDSKGKVVGINTAILSNAQGIGFAIPIEEAMQFLSR